MAQNNFQAVEDRTLGIITWLTAQQFQHELVLEQVTRAKMEIKSIFDLIAGIKGDIKRKVKREYIHQ